MMAMSWIMHIASVGFIIPISTIRFTGIAGPITIHSITILITILHGTAHPGHYHGTGVGV